MEPNQLKNHLTLGGILLVVFVAAGLLISALTQSKFAAPKRDGLYAVFLTNNQVYFGSISSEDEHEVMLKEIYYIQSKSPTDKDQDISLLKLGNELHGPEDQMEINRDHVLFIEKLKDDGRVSKAIKAYRQK